MSTPSVRFSPFRLFLHPVYTQFDAMSSVFTKKFLGDFLHPFAPPLPPNSSSCVLICRFIEPKSRLYNSRFTTTFLLELNVEVTPPPPRHFQYPVPSCVYKESRAHTYATAQTATDTADGVLTLYKGAKTSESQRAAQTLNRESKRRLKRFTRRRRFSSHNRRHRHHEKTYTLYNNRTKTSRLSRKHTKTQKCL